MAKLVIFLYLKIYCLDIFSFFVSISFFLYESHFFFEKKRFCILVGQNVEMLQKQYQVFLAFFEKPTLI